MRTLVHVVSIRAYHASLPKKDGPEPLIRQRPWASGGLALSTARLFGAVRGRVARCLITGATALCVQVNAVRALTTKQLADVLDNFVSFVWLLEKAVMLDPVERRKAARR